VCRQQTRSPDALTKEVHVLPFNRRGACSARLSLRHAHGSAPAKLKGVGENAGIAGLIDFVSLFSSCTLGHIILSLV
jgi:hypothetical protein